VDGTEVVTPFTIQSSIHADGAAIVDGAAADTVMDGAAAVTAAMDGAVAAVTSAMGEAAAVTADLSLSQIRLV